MKEAETMKEFQDKLSKIVTEVRLLGEELNDQHVLEKLVCPLERFESKISSLDENNSFFY